jgi:hypothetical protein
MEMGIPAVFWRYGFQIGITASLLCNPDSNQNCAFIFLKRCMFFFEKHVLDRVCDLSVANRLSEYE